MADEAQANGETFGEFKGSFAYGTRNDLFFKWLKNLPEEEAAEFLRKLLWLVGDAIDTKEWSPVVQHVIESEIRAYSPRPGADPPQWSYEDTPFTPFVRTLEDSNIALIASSGHFVAGKDPSPLGIGGMTQDEAALRINDFLRASPQLTEIPVDTPRESLLVRHPGYDIRGAERDPNVVFPMERLVELARDGTIGRVASPAISFVGAAAQLRVKRETVPDLIDRMRNMQADAVLLVAA